MLEIERARHQPTRGFVLAIVGAAAAVAIALCIFDASGMDLSSQITIQRANAW